MASAAVVGGIILSLIEGMGIWMNNYFSMPPPGMEGTFICFVKLVVCYCALLLVFWDGVEFDEHILCSTFLISIHPSYFTLIRSKYGKCNRTTSK